METEHDIILFKRLGFDIKMYCLYRCVNDLDPIGGVNVSFDLMMDIIRSYEKARKYFYLENTNDLEEKWDNFYGISNNKEAVKMWFDINPYDDIRWEKDNMIYELRMLKNEDYYANYDER